MEELEGKNYAVRSHQNSPDGEFTVFVREGQVAGAELKTILARYGYAPVFPSPYNGHDFLFKVDCEPANWQNWTEPSYDFIDFEDNNRK
jgi:hypothetical protein